MQYLIDFSWKYINGANRSRINIGMWKPEKVILKKHVDLIGVPNLLFFQNVIVEKVRSRRDEYG